MDLVLVNVLPVAAAVEVGRAVMTRVEEAALANAANTTAARDCWFDEGVREAGYVNVAGLAGSAC